MCLGLGCIKYKLLFPGPINALILSQELFFKKLIKVVLHSTVEGKQFYIKGQCHEISNGNLEWMFQIAVWWFLGLIFGLPEPDKYACPHHLRLLLKDNQILKYKGKQCYIRKIQPKKGGYLKLNFKLRSYNDSMKQKTWTFATNMSIKLNPYLKILKHGHGPIRGPTVCKFRERNWGVKISWDCPMNNKCILSFESFAFHVRKVYMNVNTTLTYTFGSQ